jgi:hypothetical protein
MRRKLSRTVRLLELIVRVQAKPRFTAADLAKEFGVSRPACFLEGVRIGFQWSRTGG